MHIPDELQAIATNYIIISTDHIREIKKGIKRTDFTPNTVDYSFSEDAIKLILQIDDYKIQLLKLLNSNADIITFGSIKHGDISVVGRISKSNFASNFYKYYKLGLFSDIANIDDLAAQIIDAVNPYNEKGLYEIDVDGKHISIDKSKLINFILKDYKNYDLEKEFSINGLSKDEFFYVLSSYIKDEKIVKKYILPLTAVDFIKEIEVDKYAATDYFNVFNETKDSNLNKFTLNDELKAAVLKKLPNDFNSLEKAIYVYIKLAQTLTYDSNFYAADQKGKQAEIHSDISRLSTITPQNSSVVCFEFTQLYGKLLNEIGINYDIPETEIYGSEHTSLKFRAGRHIVIADSVKSIFGGDMFSSKVGEMLDGLTSDSLNDEVYEEFDETLKRIYNYVLKTEPTPFMQENSFDHFRQLYRQIMNAPQIPKDKKKELLIQRCKEVSLPIMDKLSYLIKYSKAIFMTEYNGNKFERVVVSQSKDGALTPLIIFYFSDKPFNENGQMNFLIYDPVENLCKELSKEQIQEQFDLNIFAYVGKSDRKIPNLKFGGRGNDK